MKARSSKQLRSMPAAELPRPPLAVVPSATLAAFTDRLREHCVRIVTRDHGARELEGDELVQLAVLNVLEDESRRRREVALQLTAERRAAKKGTKR